MKNIEKKVILEHLDQINWNLQQQALAAIGLAGFIIFFYDVALWFHEVSALPEDAVISGSGLAQAIIAFFAGFSALIYYYHRKRQKMKEKTDDNV